MVELTKWTSSESNIVPFTPQDARTMKALTRLGYNWRSSYWFVTVVVGFGIFVDILVYSILIPVSPFYLNRKGYNNTPALVGWLLTAYSLGLVSCTLPLVIFAERFTARKWPFIAGLLLLVASQVMFWEAPSYVTMVIARIIQGIASALVWIVGLALICDCSPPEVVGRQLGFAMSGFASGSVLGPPLGSLLYDHFGMAGPLTLGALVAGLDLIGRLLVIERHNDVPSTAEISDQIGVQTSPGDVKVKLHSSLRIMRQIGESPRLVCSLCLELFAFGMVNTMIDTGLPLRLKDVYNSTTTQVGLFLLAGGAPTFAAPPLGGYLSDKLGTEWTIPLGIALSIPWWLLLLIHMKVGGLITVYAFGRFISVGVYTACSTEMARATEQIESVQYIHIYAMSILAYGIGSVVGPLLAGQLYAHLHQVGWTIICVVVAGVRCLAIPFLFWWTGDVPLRKRFQKAVSSL